MQTPSPPGCKPPPLDVDFPLWKELLKGASENITFLRTIKKNVTQKIYLSRSMSSPVQYDHHLEKQDAHA